MSCFLCCSSHQKKAAKRLDNREDDPYSPPSDQPLTPPSRRENSTPIIPTEGTNTKQYGYREAGDNNIAAETFTFRELATATKNFRRECLLGEGGFGRVYKGRFEKTGQVVAVKQLNPNGLQGNKEFLVEMLMLSSLHHPNLVNLIGYCADGEQRLLVYEYMSLGSLEDHLLDIPAERDPLDWSKRMKIAIGAAKGLGYLHDKAHPPIIYRDLKSSNILLDRDYSAKLSDFGFAKVGPVGEKKYVSSRVMGTYGYCAPEYQRTGQLTVKSDVYSYGVVLLELITGKRVVDTMRPAEEQNLVSWAQPIFKEPQRCTELADPLLKGNFPVKDLNQVVAVAAMCLQEDASARPMMSDVVTALSFLGSDSGTNSPPPASTSPPSYNILGTHDSPLGGTERERAIAEAMEWGSASRIGSVSSSA